MSRNCSFLCIRYPRLDQSGLGGPVLMGLADSTHKLYACGVHGITAILCYRFPTLVVGVHTLELAKGVVY